MISKEKLISVAQHVALNPELVTPFHDVIKESALSELVLLQMVALPGQEFEVLDAHLAAAMTAGYELGKEEVANG